MELEGFPQPHAIKGSDSPTQLKAAHKLRLTEERPLWSPWVNLPTVMTRKERPGR